MENPLIAYGKMLKGFRYDNCMSQTEAAKRLGVSQVAISDWESGRRFPRPENRQAMKELYDMPLEADVFNLLDQYTKDELKKIVVGLLENRVR